MKRTLSVILSLVLIMTFAITSLGLTTIAVKSIKLNTSSIKLQVGKTYNLKVTFTPANATNKKLTYLSVSTKIATVDKNGKIKGIKAGKTIITVTSSSNKKAVAKITVTVVQAGLPFVKLDYYLPQSPQKDDQIVHDAINKILKAKLNLELVIHPTDWGQWNQKKQLILSSGEPCDMIFSASWDSYYIEVGKNQYLPIDDLLQKYGQDILKLSVDGYLQAAKVKGKAYGVAVNKDSVMNRGFWLTQDTVTKLNLDSETLSKMKYLEDMEPILADIKNKIPGVVPIHVSANLAIGFAGILGATKEADDIGFRDQSKFAIFESDGLAYDFTKQETVVFYDMPSYINQAKLLAKWLKLGYVNSDILTSQSDGYDMIKNGKAAMTTGNISPIQYTNIQTLCGVPMFKTPITTTIGIKGGVDLFGAATCLPIACSNPERAIMMINESFINEELMNLWCFGIENIHYTKVSEHVIKMTEKAANYEGPWWQFGNWYIGEKGIYTKDNDDPEKFFELKKFTAAAAISPLLGFSFDTSPIKTEMAAHQNVLSQYANILANGNGDADDIAKKMKEKDKAAGIDKILAEYNKQIKAFLAGQ